MRRMTRFVGVAMALSLLLALLASSVLAGPPVYKPHLKTLGFDTLGEPSSGLNREPMRRTEHREHPQDDPARRDQNWQPRAR